MKNIFLASITLCLCFISCDTDVHERPDTKLSSTPVNPGGGSGSGPAYTSPSCNPAANKTECGTIYNFQVQFNSGPAVTLNNNTLTLEYQNGNNDQMTIVLSPFIPRQSNNFDLVNTPGAATNYKAYAELYGNSLSFSNKFQVISQSGSRLHFKYDSVNDNYTMIFCNSIFYYNGSSSVAMNGKFSFIYP